MALKQYEPINPLAGGGGGGGAGANWAQQKLALQQKQQALELRRQALEQQRSQHQQAVMEKVSDYMWTIGSLPPSKRGPYFAIASKQAEMMGVDISSWKPMISDPSFQIDVAGPLKQLVQGVKNQDPKTVAQAFPLFNAAMHDPLAGRQMLGEVMRSAAQGSQIDQRQTNANQNKEGDTLTKYQGMLNRDKNYVSLNGVLEHAQTTRSLIDDAKQNPVANNMLPISLVQSVLSNSSRVNIQELKSAKGSQALLDKAKQVTKQMAEGTLTEDNASWMTDLVDKVEKGASASKAKIEQGYAKQYSKRTGKDLSSAYEDLTGVPMPEEISTDSKSEKSAMDDDKKAAIQSKIEELRKSKMPEDQIQKHLSEFLPADQLKGFGFGAEEKAPAAAAPNLQTPAPISAPPAAGKVQAPAETLPALPDEADQEEENP